MEKYISVLLTEPGAFQEGLVKCWSPTNYPPRMLELVKRESKFAFPHIR